MKKTKHSEEKIIAAVKQMEAGRPVKEIARELGVTDQTLYNWKSKYGGMDVSDAKRLRSLEEENRRLKEMVADCRSGSIHHDAPIAGSSKESLC
jgi:putative transposase